MPAVSRRQARFLRSVGSGDAKAPGLSKREAREMVEGHKTRSLPEKAPKAKR